MKILRLILALTIPFTSTARPQVTDNDSPTLEISFPNHLYEKSGPSPREMDWKESELIIFNRNGASNVHAQLHDGIYEVRREVGGDWVRFNWVRFIPGRQDGEEIALVCLDWVATMASADDYGVIQVFHMKDGRRKVVEQILFNTRGRTQPAASFDSRTATLTVEAVHGWEHCCPTKLDVVELRLEEGLFKQSGYRQTPLQ